MPVVKLSSQSREWPWFRQTPGSKGAWGECQFTVDPSVQECDFWVVYEGLAERESANCPKENTVLIAGEPASIRSYDRDFLSQFGRVITVQRRLKHDNAVRSQVALPWWVGMRLIPTSNRLHKWENGSNLDYDRLKTMERPSKSKMISVLTSDKTRTKGHRKRLEFARRLESEFGAEVDVFIYGKNGPADKWDAIADYRYHIAIENCRCPDYFTEKLSDTFLGFSHPLYYGCTNIGEYFPRGSFTEIDINDWESSIQTIRKAIDDDRFAHFREELMMARELILDQYNLFPTVAEMVKSSNASARSGRTVLDPEVKKPRRPWESLQTIFSKC
ncbi:MAG: glycosyltransferase family 10 [Methanomassiliicoccales archaeon]|nr:glycosyltransferase family 10 [Methanomassiliicoccales archaeon]